jgi:hypothetical protein
MIIATADRIRLAIEMIGSFDEMPVPIRPQGKTFLSRNGFPRKWAVSITRMGTG